MKRRALYHAAKGLKPSAISRALADEGLAYSQKSVWTLLRKFREIQSTTRKSGSGRPTKITARVKELVENQMQKDDETTAVQLGQLLQANGIKLSRSTILRCRRQLGWTYRGAAYCQQIREVNKQKRLLWCQENLNTDFANVIWTDETTVQLAWFRFLRLRRITTSTGFSFCLVGDSGTFKVVVALKPDCGGPVL